MMFDPYHKWLGIPKDRRPPTYYQLLGISPAEQDVEVIDGAAIRQTAYIRTFQVGPYAAACTQILNEIAQARITLINPAKRKVYDASISTQIPLAEMSTPERIPGGDIVRPSAKNPFGSLHAE